MCLRFQVNMWIPFIILNHEKIYFCYNILIYFLLFKHICPHHPPLPHFFAIIFN